MFAAWLLPSLEALQGWLLAACAQNIPNMFAARVLPSLEALQGWLLAACAQHCPNISPTYLLPGYYRPWRPCRAGFWQLVPYIAPISAQHVCCLGITVPGGPAGLAFGSLCPTLPQYQPSMSASWVLPSLEALQG